MEDYKEGKQLVHVKRDLVQTNGHLIPTMRDVHDEEVLVYTLLRQTNARPL